MQSTTALLALAATLSISTALPSHLDARNPAAAVCTGSGAFEWFITPYQGNSCSEGQPMYNPNSGFDDDGATCAPLYNLQADPNGATTFGSATVATQCGGWNVTLYTTDDCSDAGSLVTGVNAVPDCVVAANGTTFTRFSAVQS